MKWNKQYANEKIDETIFYKKCPYSKRNNNSTCYSCISFNCWKNKYIKIIRKRQKELEKRYKMR